MSAQTSWSAWQAATLKERERSQVCLNVALQTLNQIATTPRNLGARHSAFATAKFIETQIEAAAIKQGGAGS